MGKNTDKDENNSLLGKIIKFLKHVIFSIAIDGIWEFFKYLWDLMNGLPTGKDVGDPAHGLGNGADSTAITPTEIPINETANISNEENEVIMFGAVSNETILGTKLVHAVRNGSMQYLISVVEQTPIINARDKDGKTALIAACECNSLEKVEYLLNLNIEHPLMPRMKVDVNKTDNEGNTALMYVAKTGNKAIAKHLIEKGAKLELRNKEDKTALDIARENRNIGIILLIQETVLEKKRKKLRPIKKIHIKPYPYLENPNGKKREKQPKRILVRA